jgi:hypothetical protein
MKWVPFLHTYRGRGFYLILYVYPFSFLMRSLGSLCTGLGIIAFVIGVIVFLVGVTHLFLACYFRETLDPSTG